MIVVSDTSPITNLAAVGLLDILHQLYDRVIIPQGVYDEMASLNYSVPGALEVQTLSWIDSQSVSDITRSICSRDKYVVITVRIIFTFPVDISYAFSIPMILGTSGLVWWQLGKLLGQLMRGSRRSIWMPDSKIFRKKQKPGFFKKPGFFARNYRQRAMILNDSTKHQILI